MTICDDCKKEYGSTTSCTFSKVSIEEKMYPREGTYISGKEFSSVLNDEGKTCDDCGVLVGRVHHSGCTLEICPVCKEALATCGCDDVVFGK